MRKNMVMNLLMAVISLVALVLCAKADGIFNAVAFLVGAYFLNCCVNAFNIWWEKKPENRAYGKDAKNLAFEYYD